MATQTIDVRVNTGQAISAVNGLRSALGALGAAVSVTALARFSDSIQGVQNRLRSLNPDVAAVAGQFDAISKIAISTRAPLESVGDLFFRIARSADQVGISMAQAAEITDTLAKGMAASGLSAAEAAGPLLQIGQALQSGRFQGDELRSVLEGMPVVARALADELGVPIGALRKLGSEGKITAEVFVRAMQNARDGVNEAFGRTVPTIAQSMTVLRNSVALAFNQFETNTQTGQTFARMIEYVAFTIYRLSNTIDDIIGPIVTFAKVVGTLITFVVVNRLVGAAVTVFKSLLGILTAGGRVLAGFWGALKKVGDGFGAVKKSVGESFKSFNLFGTLIGKIISGLGALGAVVGSFLGFGEISKLFDDLKDSTSDSAKELEAWRAEMAQFGTQLDTTVPEVQQFNALTEEQRLAIANIAKEYQRSTAAARAQFAAENDVIQATTLQRNMMQALTSAFAEYESQRQKVIDKIKEAEAKGGDELAQIPLLKAALEDLEMTYRANSDAIAALVIEQERLTRAKEFSNFVTKEQQSLEDKLQNIYDEMAKLTLPEIERKYYDIQRAAMEQAKAAIRAEEARRGEPLDAAEAQRYYETATAGVNKLRAAQEQLTRQQRSFSTGWKKAFNDYVDSARNAAETASRLFKTFTSGMEDMIVNFAKTGKFEWKGFVSSMLEELLRSQVRETMASIMSIFGVGDMFGGGGGAGQQRGATPNSPLYVMDVSGGNLGRSMSAVTGNQSTRSGGGGGLMDFVTGIGDFFGGVRDVVSDAGSWINKNIFGGFFANGGTLPAGKIGIVGERGPELISGPANITPMGATQITYNINAVDARSFQQLVAQDPAFIYSVTEQGRRSFAGAR